MSTAEETRWIEPYAGLTYREREMTVDPANEQRLITTCGIDPADFGGMIDPSTFISIAIQEGVLNGVSANGSVNMAQRLIQHEPIPTGEPIIVTGKILDVQPVPRGKVSISDNGVIAALEPWKASESMINFLGDVSGPEEVAAAYPPATLQRLREVKATVDPAGIFSFGHAF